ncbi:MAG: hypothetical protein PHC70_00840 [Patescibacteria group bacterium]|nr:hypothetical protein [Patescibacteria group bacterium]
MSFKSENINSAIIATQYDLRGFYHPLGFRMKRGECGAKLFSCIPGNLVVFAIGFGSEPRNATDDSYVPRDASYEEYLNMCRRFAEDCNPAQKEAVQIILEEVKTQAEEVKRSSGRQGCFLDEGSEFEKVMKALTQVFS